MSKPVSIDELSRPAIADCIRKWTAGAALTEREREIVDDALAVNRLEMIGSVFVDREVDHVG